ncbi:MAG: WXG100 family type VII secretion target [Coprobacillaceae bacterium]
MVKQRKRRKIIEIGINSVGLEEIKGQLTVQKEAFIDVIAALRAEIEKIPECWVGSAAEEYANQFESLQPTFNNVEELIETITTQITQVVSTTEGLDDEIAGILKGA